MDAEAIREGQDALLLVHERNFFYREKFRFALGVYVLSLIANIVLIGIIVYLITHPSQSLYFPADKNGKLIQVVPVSEANMSNQDVMNWAIQAVEAAYSYDYLNYRAQLQDAQKYFTNYGWRNYMDALRVSNNLVGVTERKQVVIAKVVAQPTLTRQALLAGAMAWKFRMPLLVTYLMPPFNDKNKYSNALLVDVLIQRQNELQSYYGLGVLQLVAVTAT